MKRPRNQQPGPSTRRQGRLLAALLSVAALPLSARAASEAEVTAALAEFNREAHYALPTLSAAQRKRLMAGDVVKIVDTAPDGSGSRRAMGVILTEVSRDAMWLSCQDLHFVQNSSVHEIRLKSPSADKARWYGLVDLPRPFSDRHYVVDVWNNRNLAEKTAGRAWEHPWTLVPGGVAAVRGAVEAGEVPKTDLDMWEAAIETPTNMGAWVAIALTDGSSIFAYHAATRVGGNIPEGMMLQYVKATLDDTLRAIEKRALHTIPAHYSGDHPPVEGGDRRAVAHFPR